jgi:DNA-binding transcriptional MerR regulator
VTGAAATEGRMNIGEVHARLREEFPQLQMSKLRYFEAEGLVEPTRTPAGYRKYTHADIERLRLALVLQRDHHLPLKIIKEQLEARDRGIEPPALSGSSPAPRLVVSADGTPSAGAFVADPSTLRLTRRELLAAAEIDESLLRDLEAYGLVTPRPGAAPYDNEATVIAKTAAELAGFGIEPRHLRAFRTAADREVGLVEQVAAPIRRSREQGAEGRADEAMTHIASLSVRLHAMLVKVALRRLR